MPGQNALDLQQALVASGQELPVVFITRPVPYGAGKGGVIDAPGDGKIRTLVRRRAS